MQYGLVNGIRTEPSEGLKGVCPGCLNPIQAKCGSINIHHWAHIGARDCDPWYEPETEWHRDWKNKFPEQCREITFEDPLKNEIHRADVHTRDGITLEFQNSHLPVTEIKSRDEFYKKLIWIVNGLKFKDNFTLTCNIPNPATPLLDDFEFVAYNEHIRTLDFRLKSEIKSNTGGFSVVRNININDPELKNVLDQFVETQGVYWLFRWKQKHKAWFETRSNMFFDFGRDYLYWLRFKEQISCPFWYVQAVKKAEFVKKYSV